MKKVILWVGIILLAGLVWYLFIKPFDYLVRFEVKTNSGTVNQLAKTWHKSHEKAGVMEQTNLNEFSQTFTFNDTLHHYSWKVARLTDSTSLVKVYAKDTDHSFNNKISIPFRDTDFEKRTRKTLLDFNEKLAEHLKNHKVTIIGEEAIPAKYCAYLSLETSQLGKAGGMMRDYNYLSGELVKYQIQLDGPPFVEITNWDMEKDSIQFNFCYPIKKTDSLPDLGEIQYKEILSKKAVKAIYNGNYIFSDRAWYALRDYANERDLEIINTPIEIFYNNPTLGADEINWKAEIYLPLKERDE